MKRGNTLVGMMVAIVIIAILAVVFMRGNNTFSAPGTGSTRADGRGTTIPGAAMLRAKDVQCQSDLQQIRESLMILHDGDPDGKWPDSLQETKFGSDFMKCPVGGEPYQYDPQTGKVKCVHPGHEKY